MRVAVVAHRPTQTNRRLARAYWGRLRAILLTPAEAVVALGPGDAALARLDVLESLDGVEPGLWELDTLSAAGVRVLNRPPGLLTAHDKLVTAHTLRAAGLPHPATELVTGEVRLEPPLVLKPRFGSWGRDVVLCPTRAAVRQQLTLLRDRPWFEAGALAQELVPPRGHDLRLVVAGGRVVGAARRVAAPGEWRTNVALGASRAATVPPQRAVELALAAAEASGLDLVGVDLLPLGHADYVVLELNGAVDFTEDYRLLGDPFALAVEALHAQLGERGPVRAAL